LKRERAAILQNALIHKRPLTWQEKEQLFIWYSTRVDAYLDAGHGDCFMKQPQIAELVCEALQFFEGERHELYSWCVMPNHVHAVVWPKPPFSLSQVLHSWKSYTSNKANKLLKRSGNKFWQDESFDHLIRNDTDRIRCGNYINDNPVKAGLCKRPEDWRWGSAYLKVNRLCE
jgi:REP element-mobilizing transposase RayT